MPTAAAITSTVHIISFSSYSYSCSYYHYIPVEKKTNAISCNYSSLERDLGKETRWSERYWRREGERSDEGADPPQQAPHHRRNAGPHTSPVYRINRHDELSASPDLCSPDPCLSFSSPPSFPPSVPAALHDNAFTHPSPVLPRYVSFFSRMSISCSSIFLPLFPKYNNLLFGEKRNLGKRRIDRLSRKRNQFMLKYFGRCSFDITNK